jgi:hypothetical protein
VEGQVRRYYFGLVAFGFVVAWATTGLTTAMLAVAACGLIVLGPRLLAHGQAKPRKSRPRPVRTRPLHEELPLVPDDPSLIVELV